MGMGLKAIPIIHWPDPDYPSSEYHSIMKNRP